MTDEYEEACQAYDNKRAQAESVLGVVLQVSHRLQNDLEKLLCQNYDFPIPAGKNYRSNESNPRPDMNVWPDKATMDQTLEGLRDSLFAMEQAWRDLGTEGQKYKKPPDKTISSMKYPRL
jgi:hypothetical protein